VRCRTRTFIINAAFHVTKLLMICVLAQDCV
jgi:hypothetical protein